MASPQFSKIYYELDDSGKSRYREKLNRIGDGVQDPYFPHSSFLPTEEYPLVEYGDIYNYLIDAPSPHTKEQLKAYKSLQGYRFCLAGWVGNVRAFTAGKSSSARNVVVLAKVRHSQSVSSPNLQPWVALENNGTVICAHFTCTAGLGEACSHISAILYSLWSRTKLVEDALCTSKACQWIEPSLRPVEYARVKDIDFTSPGKKTVWQKAGCS